MRRRSFQRSAMGRGVSKGMWEARGAFVDFAVDEEDGVVDAVATAV